eukprot:Awhi_evm1s1898
MTDHIIAFPSGPEFEYFYKKFQADPQMNLTLCRHDLQETYTNGFSNAPAIRTLVNPEIYNYDPFVSINDPVQLLLMPVASISPTLSDWAPLNFPSAYDAKMYNYVTSQSTPTSVYPTVDNVNNCQYFASTQSSSVVNNCNEMNNVPNYPMSPPHSPKGSCFPPSVSKDSNINVNTQSSSNWGGVHTDTFRNTTFVDDMDRNPERKFPLTPIPINIPTPNPAPIPTPNSTFSSYTAIDNNPDLNLVSYFGLLIDLERSVSCSIGDAILAKSIKNALIATEHLEKTIPTSLKEKVLLDKIIFARQKLQFQLNKTEEMEYFMKDLYDFFEETSLQLNDASLFDNDNNNNNNVNNNDNNNVNDAKAHIQSNSRHNSIKYDTPAQNQAHIDIHKININAERVSLSKPLIPKNELPKRIGKVTKTKKSTLPKAAVEYLSAWVSDNPGDPFPTAEEKTLFEEKTGLSKKQIQYWFTNLRRRKKPVINMSKVNKTQEINAWYRGCKILTAN